MSSVENTTEWSHSERTPLEERRTAKGLTREELSAISRVSFRTIYRIEKRKVTPHRATLLVLAAALDLMPSDLIEENR